MIRLLSQLILIAEPHLREFIGTSVRHRSHQRLFNAMASLASSRPKPICVVIEGLDGVGKSTAAEMLATRLGAKLLRTPPDELRSARPYFDRGDEATRRTYYMVGNFLVGDTVKKLLEQGTPCVVDRWYASTLSYRYGKSEKPLPPAGDEAYAWPPELHRPDYMVLLTMPHADRVSRRAGRTSVAETVEEAHLRENAEAAERINEAYRRFGCAEVRIAASDSVDAVVDKVLAVIDRDWLGEEAAQQST